MIRISREFSQISIKYLTDFSRISKNISWIYLDISQISVDSSQRVKKKKLEKPLKKAMSCPNLTGGYTVIF